MRDREKETKEKIEGVMKTRKYDFLFEFVELEQADGQTIFIAGSSVIKFCEHGTTPGSEPVPDRSP